MCRLILIPSDPERDAFAATGLPDDCVVANCGVGLVASAVETTRLIQIHQPRHVFLAGIAGGLQPDRPVGSVVIGSSVFQSGLGAGEAESFESMESLGFDRFLQNTRLQTPDQLPLWTPAGTSDASGGIVSVAAASANDTQAQRHCCAFENVAAEDMESYSVAFACRQADIPLTVVRGISNVAGDRNPAAWDFKGAMKAAQDVLLEILGNETKFISTAE